jgi:hypothetical protein
MVKPQDRDEKVLCFDNGEGLLCDVGQGEPFFDGDGLGKAAQEMLNLLSQTEASRVLTQRLVDALQAAELIHPWALNVKQGEQTIPVEGIYRIDEAALNALPDEAYLTLRKTGALPLAYAQLFSMNQLAMLPKAAEVQARIKGQLQAQAASQKPPLSDFDFLLSEEATFKFT